MPLDRKNGEIVGDLGRDFQVAPLDRWAGTPLFAEASAHASRAFIQAGALLPIEYRDQDVLIQEYPRQHKIAFLFQRRIAGKEHFYPYVFDLPIKLVEHLRASGKWGYAH